MTEERRDWGTGSIVWREDRKVWYGRQRVRLLDGSAKSAEVTSRISERDCEKRLKDKAETILREDAKGVDVRRVRRNLTLAKYLEDWLKRQDEAVAAGTLTWNTVRQRHLMVERHISPYIGDVALAGVRTSTVKSLMHRLMAEGHLSNQSVVHAVRTLSKALADAAEDGLISSNPVPKVTLPKADPGRPEVMTGEQTLAVLRLLSPQTATDTDKKNEEDVPAELKAGRRYGAAFWLLATTGMRAGEVLGLEEQDLYLPESGDGLVTIRQQWKSGREGWELGPTKTKAGVRTVEVIEPVVAILRAHVDKVRTERADHAGIWPEDTAVFVNSRGRRPEGYVLSKAFRKAVDIVGAGKTIHTHSLRHAVVTLLTDGGIPHTVLMRQVGWSSMAPLARYLAKGDAKDARIGATMRGFIAPA